MSLIKEDWERVHLMDEMYLKEMEYLEQEHLLWEEYDYNNQKPAIIKVPQIEKIKKQPKLLNR